MFAWIGKLFGSAASTAATGGIGLYIKIGLAVALVTAAGGLYYQYHHMESEVTAAQQQIGQLTVANQVANGQITGLKTDVSNVLDRVNAAETQRSALSDEVNSLESRVAIINRTFATKLNTLKTPSEKQAFINTTLQTTMFCIEQLTTDVSKRDPTYSEKCVNVQAPATK